MASLERVSTLKFRGLLADIGLKLSEKEIEALAFVYLDKENIENIESGSKLMDRITKRDQIRNCESDLNCLAHSLERVGRADLKKVVAKYIKVTSPPQESTERLPSSAKEASGHVSSTNPRPLEERDSNITKSTVYSGIGGIGYGQQLDVRFASYNCDCCMQKEVRFS